MTQVESLASFGGAECIGSGCPVCYPYLGAVRADADKLRREERQKTAVWICKFAAAGAVGLFPWLIGVILLGRWLIESLR